MDCKYADIVKPRTETCNTLWGGGEVGIKKREAPKNFLLFLPKFVFWGGTNPTKSLIATIIVAHNLPPIY